MTRRWVSLALAVGVICGSAIMAGASPRQPAGATKIFIQGADYLRRGEQIVIYGYYFFPPDYCGKKVKFRLYDSDGGGSYYLGKQKVKRHDWFLGVGPFIADIPVGASLGKAKVKAKQDCGPIRGSTSDKEGLIIGTKTPGPAPDVTNAHTDGGLVGEVVDAQFRVQMQEWDFEYLTLRVELEVTPDRWEEVAVLERDQIVYKPKGYAFGWRAKIAGKVAPPGRYRFVFEFYSDPYVSGRGGQPRSSETEEFNVADQAVGGLISPIDAELNPQGELLVADKYHHRLAVYSQDLTFLREILGLKYPRDVGVTPDGTMYVANGEFNSLGGFGEIVVLDPNGTEINRFAEGGFANRSEGPVGIAVTPLNGGRVYVVDGSSAPCVFVFDLDGNPLADIEDASCDGPLDVAVAPDGTIWVADEASDAARHYAADGTPLGQAENSIPGALPTFLEGHETVDVTQGGHLLVGAHHVINPGSSGSPGIFEFDADGGFLRILDEDLVTDPTGVTAAGLTGDFYVVQKGSNSVLYLRVP